MKQFKTVLAALSIALGIAVAGITAQNYLVTEVVEPQEKIVTVWIDNVISQGLAKSLYEKIEGADKVRVILDSPGGHAFEMISVVNVLQDFQRKGGHVTTEIYGFGMSAAAVMFLVGDDRIMHSGSVLMLHEARYGGYGKSYRVREFREMEKWHLVDSLTLINDVMAELLREKTELTERQIKYWLEFEDANYMSAKEALDWGMATELR
jgi:ATP-dependent protease ClpP protease subunit